MVNKKERFVNVNEHIYQYGEWYCSAKGEHCADVITTALNMYDELEKEHEKLEQQFKDRIKYTHQLEVELKKLEAKQERAEDFFNEEERFYLDSDGYVSDREYEFGLLGQDELVEIINDLNNENKELKQFKNKVFELLEEKIKEYPYLTLSEKWDNNCEFKHSCRGNHEKNVMYASKNILLKELQEELQS